MLGSTVVVVVVVVVSSEVNSWEELPGCDASNRETWCSDWRELGWGGVIFVCLGAVFADRRGGYESSADYVSIFPSSSDIHMKIEKDHKEETTHIRLKGVENLRLHAYVQLLSVYSTL